MKKIMTATLLACIMIVFSSYAFASSATKDECVSMCKKAVAMISDKGIDAGLAEIGNPKGQFVWKDSYIFVVDTKSGKVVTHPIKPGLVGKNLMGVKDVNGKLFFAEFLKVGQSSTGTGWVSYMWPKPGEKKPSKKNSYVLKVPDHSIIVIAGFYE